MYFEDMVITKNTVFTKTCQTKTNRSWMSMKKHSLHNNFATDLMWLNIKNLVTQMCSSQLLSFLQGNIGHFKVTTESIQSSQIEHFSNNDGDK